MWWLWISSALAWGPSAHQAVGARAQHALTPEASAALAELTDRSLAELSTELDDLKRTPTWQWSRPLHFVNADPHAPTLQPDCPDHLCATDALVHFSHRLATHSEPEVRREALMAVVHLVGDLHQPLHVSYAADRGGNDHEVWLDGKRTDLHTIWDHVVPERAGALDPVELTPAEVGGHPHDWASESFELTRTVVYTLPSGTVIDEPYLSAAEPVVARRVAQAGARLGMLLNDALVGRPPVVPDPLAGADYDRGWRPTDSAAGRAAIVSAGVLVLGLLALLRWRARPGPGWRAMVALSRIRGLAGLALLAVLLTISVDIISPLAIKYGLDVVVPSPTPARVGTLTAMLAGAVLMAVVGWLLAASSLSRLASSFQQQLRQKMLLRLQGAPLPAVRARSVADVLGRFQGDLQQFDAFLLRELPKLVRSAVQAVGLLAVMIGIEWRLTLATVLLMPPVVWLPRRMAGAARQARHVRQDAEAHAGEVVHELVDSLPVLRAFGLEAHWRRRFEARAERVRQAALRQGWLSVMIPGVGFTTGQSLTALVLLGAAWLAAAGEMTVGDLSALFSALIFLAGATSRLSTSIPATVNALGAWERICALLDLPQLPAPEGEVRPLATGIELHGVVFSHDGDKRHLDDVAITIPAGQATAVVGPSGSGKSTLLWLLLHHAQPDDGEVLWDGTRLHAGHRAAIGLVPQHSPMFAMSVRDNIRLGRLEATDDEVTEAARLAAIDDAIAALPQGYDTVLGPQGVQLSGGQSQRIAIARALLRRPSLLVLDEATSALDPGTAALVRHTIDEIRQSCTTLTITHDIGAIQNYDNIIVLDDGKVRGQGAHVDLMRHCDLYRSLVEQQSGFVFAAGGRRASVQPGRLAQMALFSELSDAMLSQVAAAMVTERFAGGAVVVRCGDPGDRAFVVVRGSLDVEVPGRGRVRRCMVGELVGEIALLYGRPRSASLRAVGHCVLLSLSRRDFLRLLAAEPELADRVRQTAQARLSHAAWAEPPVRGA